MKLNLETKSVADEVIKSYLEENASEEFAGKINNGTPITKDGIELINKKDLESFMKYAADEAKKLSEKGATSACLGQDVIFGWAIHYFEEDSIEGVLYTKEGKKYKPKFEVKKSVTPTKTTVVAAPVKKPIDANTPISIFDELLSVPEKKEETAEEITEASEDVEEVKSEPVIEEPNPKLFPPYEKYRKVSEEYPYSIIAIRVGDFYELFDDTAEFVAEKLGMTLTKRDVGLEKPASMIGYPYHKADAYKKAILTFGDMAIIEADGSVSAFSFRQETNVTVNTNTGEVVEESTKETKEEPSPSTSSTFEDKALLDIIYKIFGNEIEIVR